MLTKDIYGGWWSPSASESQMMLVGKRCGWFFVFAGVSGAILLRDTTLVTMLDRKLDLLAQLCPAFMISLWWKNLDGQSVFRGMLVGIVVAIGLAVLGHAKPFGIHAGLYGLTANLLMISVNRSRL